MELLIVKTYIKTITKLGFWTINLTQEIAKAMKMV